MDAFEEAKKKHNIDTYPICTKNRHARDAGLAVRMVALDGIHGNSLVG